METPDPARGAPEHKVAATAIPAEAPAAPASSLPATSQDAPVTPAAPVAPAAPPATPPEGARPRTIAEANARIQAALAKAPEKKEPAVTPAPEIPAAPAETPETPAEAPPETPPEEAAAPEEGEDEGDDGTLKPFEGNRKHLRIPKDKVSQLATAFMSRNKDMSMEDAILAAKKQLGVEQPGIPAPADPNKPQTIAEATARTDQLEAEIEKATGELRFEDAAKLNRQLRQLDRHTTELQRKEQQAHEQGRTEYLSKFDAATARATELYPFAGNPESPEYKRMLEIDADLEATADPRFNSPDRPFLLAQMVAAERNIAPRRKGATVAPAKPAVPAVPAQKKQMLPGGGSATTPPAAPQLSPIDAKIQAPRPKTMQALRELEKGIGLRV